MATVADIQKAGEELKNFFTKSVDALASIVPD